MKEIPKNKNREFNIDKELFRNITSKECYYCGSLPKSIIKPERSNGEYIYNGIDRVNNSLGYIKGNCVPCCSICNHAKSTLEQEEFLSWIERVYNHSLINTEFII